MVHFYSINNNVVHDFYCVTLGDPRFLPVLNIRCASRWIQLHTTVILHLKLNKPNKKNSLCLLLSLILSSSQQAEAEATSSHTLTVRSPVSQWPEVQQWLAAADTHAAAAAAVRPAAAGSYCQHQIAAAASVAPPTVSSRQHSNIYSICECWNYS